MLEFIDGSLIAFGGMLILGVVGGYAGYVLLKHRVAKIEDRQETDRLEFRGEISKVQRELQADIDSGKREFRTWRDKHQDESLELHKQLTRFETKLDGLIERIDRANINGKGH